MRHVVEYDKRQLHAVPFRILIDEGLRARFGEIGNELVKERFTWGKMVEQIEDIY